MVMRKRAVGRDTFWLLAGNTWDLRHAVGIKLLDLGSRSRAQKAIVATITMRQIFRIATRKMLTSLVRMYLTFLYIVVYMINVR